MQNRAGVESASFPLSAAQLPLWLVDRNVGRRSQLVEGCVLHVHGQLDTGRLRDAIDGTVSRHPALRIGCELDAGQPRQHVHSTVPWTLAEVDYSTLAPEPAHAAATRWGREFGSAPFDVDSAPLWRAGVAMLPGGQFLLAVAAHHLICDGWTLRLLLEEVSEQYRTGAPGPDVPDGIAPYPQCLLDRDDAWRKDSAVVAYWRSVLDDCVAPRLVVPEPTPDAGHGVQATVSADVARLVRDVARRQHCTPFLVFTAVYAATIARFSGASSVPVASVYHGRTTAELKRVAGVFATLFVLPVDLTGDLSLNGLLARLHPVYSASLANRNVTLAELALERKLTREPFFNHVISYHPASFAVTGFAGMPATMDLLAEKPAPNELEFHVRELTDSFALQLRYDPAGLDAGSARTVLGAFCELLASLAADPDRPVAAPAPARG